MSDYWGYHLMLDCAGCSKVDDAENIIKFVKQLVVDIKMVAFGEPWIERFALHDPGKSGYSMFQMIETSNISGHFVDADGSAYLDIFSCMPYDIEIVKALVQEYFNPESIKQHYIERQA